MDPLQQITSHPLESVGSTISPISLSHETVDRRARRKVRRALSVFVLSVLVLLCVLMRSRITKFLRDSGPVVESAKWQDFSSLELALDAFEIDNGRYPTSQEGLGALITPSASLSNWHGPYIEKTAIPLDPWHHPYVYVCPGIHRPQTYDLSSPGSDGIVGTSDDMNNWDE